jgi:hypothetical protein
VFKHFFDDLPRKNRKGTDRHSDVLGCSASALSNWKRNWVLLKNTVVATIEKRVNIRIWCMVQTPVFFIGNDMLVRY